MTDWRQALRIVGVDPHAPRRTSGRLPVMLAVGAGSVVAWRVSWLR